MRVYGRLLLLLLLMFGITGCELFHKKQPEPVIFYVTKEVWKHHPIPERFLRHCERPQTLPTDPTNAIFYGVANHAKEAAIKCADQVDGLIRYADELKAN
jgi:hypothetical protein